MIKSKVTKSEVNTAMKVLSSIDYNVDILRSLSECRNEAKRLKADLHYVKEQLFQSICREQNIDYEFVESLRHESVVLRSRLIGLKEKEVSLLNSICFA